MASLRVRLRLLTLEDRESGTCWQHELDSVHLALVVPLLLLLYLLRKQTC